MDTFDAITFEGERLTRERSAFPHAVFTGPEIGSVGYTESAARELGIDTSVGLVTLDQVVKAKLIGETSGLIKYSRRTKDATDNWLVT